MKILLVGPGGFGRYFVDLLLDNTDKDIVFEGVVARTSCHRREDVEAAGVPFYPTVEDFYAEHTADLAIICTPSFLHASQSIYCLEHGSYVLCEKPAAPTSDECYQMMEAEKRTGRFIAIGFNMAFATGTLELKQDILDGVFGKPLSMKTIILTGRKLDYYGRGSGYAGCISKNGHLVLDSVASNACAHYVYNMLYLLGDKMNTAADANLEQCECYRANDIENFDTCTMKLTAAGIPLFFAASHAADIGTPYTFCFEFENATVTNGEGGTYLATFKDGTTKTYANPLSHGEGKKTFDCIDAIKNGTLPVCGVHTTLPHVKLIEDIYKNIPIVNFPAKEVACIDNKMTVTNLGERMLNAYEKTCMLSEI